MLLLISDANIIIDLEAGEIVETLFKLPYRFAMPDLLYAEEIEPASPYLVELGLQTLVVSGEFIEYAIRLGEQCGDEPGFNDRLALAPGGFDDCDRARLELNDLARDLAISHQICLLDR